jgi:hypothetical protein
MMELLVAVFCVLYVSLYYVESAALKGKLQVRYGWLAYSFQPIVFFFGVGLFIILVGTDWRSPLWELAAGLLLICIGMVLTVRSLLKKKEIEAKFRSGEIEP